MFQQNTPQEENINPKLKLALIFIGLLIVFTFLYLICVYYPGLRASNHRYTIARIYKRESTADGGEVAVYDFYVAGKRYSSSFGFVEIKKKTPQIGERYYLEYYPLDPDNSELIIDKQVLDSTLIIPIDGWTQLP